MFFDNVKNEHLDANTSELLSINEGNLKIFARPCMSDKSRIVEYFDGIYFQNNYLHKKILELSPKYLIDLGANIGTSSLSLVNEFKSIINVFGVEANIDNYNVLKKNYELWSNLIPDTKFQPVHSIISASKEDSFSEIDSLFSITGANSASGTFRFKKNIGEKSNFPVVDVLTLISEFAKDELFICKIDIEGSEEFLFEKNTEWLKQVCFLTIELHDKFNNDMLESSKNLIKALIEYDFAIAPEKDVLHCYSRKHITKSKLA